MTQQNIHTEEKKLKRQNYDECSYLSFENTVNTKSYFSSMYIDIYNISLRSAAAALRTFEHFLRTRRRTRVVLCCTERLPIRLSLIRNKFEFFTNESARILHEPIVNLEQILRFSQISVVRILL